MCKVLVCWTVAFNICLCVGAWYVCGVVSAYFARAGKLNSFHVALATHHETDERCRTTLVLLGCHMAVNANQHIVSPPVNQSTAHRAEALGKPPLFIFCFSQFTFSRWLSVVPVGYFWKLYRKSSLFVARSQIRVWFCEIYSRNNCGVTVIVFFNN